MIKKLLIVLVGYFLLIILLNSALDRENEWSAKQALLAANNYPHAWYLIGSSRTRRGIRGAQFRKATQRPVYDVSCSNFFMPANWVQLEAFLEKVSHKKLIVELSYNISSLEYYSSLEAKGTYFGRYFNCFLTSESYTSPYPRILLKTFTKSAYGVLDLLPADEQRSQLLSRFDAWGESTDPTLHQDQAAFQKENLQKRADDLLRYHKKIMTQGKANDYYLNHLFHLLEVAEKNGNEVYFYLPTTVNATEAEMLSCVWPYIPRKYRILTQNDPRYLRLLRKESLFDEGHLNKKGSQLLTDVVVRQLTHMKAI